MNTERFEYNIKEFLVWVNPLTYCYAFGVMLGMVCGDLGRNLNNFSKDMSRGKK